MLENVIGNYLDNIEEREFDEPFMALLRAEGFRDIHFLHGAFEFGKDFIAKKEEDGIIYQYAFQTKAGNINLTAWNQCRGQIDLLRTNALSHASFNKTFPRRAIFVTTGRLVGGAPAASQEYEKHLSELGELGFDTWDREKLIEMIRDSPEISLTDPTDGGLLKILGAIKTFEINEFELERFSRRWTKQNASQLPIWKAAIEVAVIANQLRQHHRLDLACYISLCLIRGVWSINHGKEPIDNESEFVANLGRSLFKFYGTSLFVRCTKLSLEPVAFLYQHEELTAFVNYPVRCLRVIEILGLLGLLDIEDKEVKTNEVAEYLIRFFENQPGAVHPISDRWAVSIIPPILLLAATDNKEKITSILENLIRWICDRYDGNSFGVAGMNASVEEEVNYLLGSPFEHVELNRRSESYLSTVVLDLLAMLEMGETYNLARNDFLAVNALPCVVEAQDSEGQYVLDATDIAYEPNTPYENEWNLTEGWKVAPHHKRSPESYYLARIGRKWDHLAISSVLRDRHFLSTCRAFLNSQ